LNLSENRFFFRPVTLVTFTFVLKLGIYFLFIGSQSRSDLAGGLFLDSPDRGEYITPMDNYVEHGTYALQPDNEPYAGRLPGFIFPYLLFRIVFSQNVSNFLLGIFILLMSFIASLKLVRLLNDLTGSITAVIFGLAVIMVLPYFWHSDWLLHPYSLAASCLIIGIYFIHSYFRSGEKLLYSGFFLAWLFMLRGVVFLFIPVAVLIIIIHLKRNSVGYQTLLSHLGIFILPFVLMEAFWIGRNFVTLHKFIPLQTSFVPGANGSNPEYSYNSPAKYSMMKLREFINCWGGDNFWYFKNADMAWFVYGESKTAAAEHFKPVVFEVGITPQQLDSLRKDVRYSFEKDLSQTQHDSIENRIIEKSVIFIKQFKKSKLWYYYLVAPFNRIKNFLFKSPVQDWPGAAFKDLGLIKKGIKIFSFLIYVFILILFPLVLIVKSRTILKNSLFSLLSLFTLALVFTFAFIINAAHYSYFIYGYIPAAILVISTGIPSIKAFLRSKTGKEFQSQNI
jgi:hypothetical protein